MMLIDVINTGRSGGLDTPRLTFLRDYYFNVAVAVGEGRRRERGGLRVIFVLLRTVDDDERIATLVTTSTA